MTTLPRHSAMPEFLSPRNDVESGSWTVEDGSPRRGDAWTVLDQRRMRVPTGSSEMARVVRAHEMMHARVSPVDIDHCFSAFGQYHRRVVECSEEFRVNTLVGRAGFDLTALTDGSESKSGKRLAESDQWGEAVCFMAAIAGTKASTDFLRGVRSVNPEWAKALREMEKALIKTAKSIHHKYLASTEPSTDERYTGLPSGFVTGVSKFAEIIDASIKVGEKSVIDEEGNDIDGVTEKVDAERMKTMMKSLSGTAGVFAPLRLDKNVPLTRHVAGTMGRKRIATNVGRNPRRIHRVLTDPERRIFDRTTKGMGGIVVIDQSGSMDLSTDQLWEIINMAPGCVIIGYSHRSGSTDVPNTWVLADRGRVCETVRSGNVGNGVDGPALRFALSKRKHNEPVIWVCDGAVTDGADDIQYDNLTAECVNLIIRHGIHTVATVDEAKAALAKAKNGVRLPARATGVLKHSAIWANYARSVA